MYHSEHPALSFRYNSTTLIDVALFLFLVISTFRIFLMWFFSPLFCFLRSWSLLVQREEQVIWLYWGKSNTKWFAPQTLRLFYRAVLDACKSNRTFSDLTDGCTCGGLLQYVAWVFTSTMDCHFETFRTSKTSLIAVDCAFVFSEWLLYQL